MATQFNSEEIGRTKESAGSTFKRWMFSKLLAWVNTADDRIDAIEAGAVRAIRFCTRSLTLTGASGSGYLSGQTFKINMHTSAADFNCYGVFVIADTIGTSTLGMTEGIYARVGYWPIEGGDAVFPNANYSLLKPSAVNFVPIAPDTMSGEFTPILLEGRTVPFLELTAGLGTSITSAVAELVGQEVADLPF